MNEQKRPSPDGAEEVVARLRAADPARGARPDLAALRAAVDARRGPEVTATSEGLVVIDELAARRRPRLASWPAKVAGAAAGVLLIGGGGFAAGLGAGTATVADAPDETVEVTVTAEATEESPTEDMTMEVAPEIEREGMGGEGDVGMGGQGDVGMGGGGGGGMTASIASPYGYWQHTVFTASGLSTEGGTAEGFGLDGSGVGTAERMAQVAAAFGVTGEPRDQDGYWTVGPQDGTGPTVGLYAAGDWSVNYYDPSTDLWACPVWSETATPEELAKPCEERDLGPLPSNEDALARANQVLTDLGLDPAQFSLRVSEWSDATYLNIEGVRTLGGSELDLRWSFSFTGGGLQSAYGSLAEIVLLGEYPIISPAEAVARFSDPRFMTSWAGPYDTVVGSPMRIAMEGGGEVLDAVPASPSAPPAPTAGMPFSWPVSSVTITSADLTLATHYQNDGTVLMVPTYRLYSDDGGIWRMIAVADSVLDFADGR